MSEPPMLSPIVFFGTPEFAVPTLDALSAAGRAPVAVVSQPDRRAGRGRRRSRPPVAEWASARDIPLLQPARVKDAGFQTEVAAFTPALAVVVAFGQIFPRSLLELPTHGCVNLHGSLLPAYRGASPISAAIAAGDGVTGVSTMLMEVGLDSGPVLLQQAEPIGPRDTTGSLSLRLARIGGDLVVSTLERWERGELEPSDQDDSAASFAPRLVKEDGLIDWGMPAVEIERRIRAFTPWPGATTAFRGERLRVLEAAPAESVAAGAAPGALIEVAERSVLVACGVGVLALDRVQRAGRRPLSGRDFWNGERPTAGERLGDGSASPEGELQ